MIEARPYYASKVNFLKENSYRRSKQTIEELKLTHPELYSQLVQSQEEYKTLRL